ncbi:uncharacterized protein [Panulirus ornatus]|uniref:uncharacterized protein isoform X2 n=1 Tax=Panulirus ornatus TaxID=150431 RepID=UPI003A86CDEC
MQMLGAEVVPGIPVSSMMQVVAGGVVGMSGSSPAPIPASVTSTSTSELASPGETSPVAKSSVPSSIPSGIPVPVPSSITSPGITQVTAAAASLTPPSTASSNSATGPTPSLLTLSPSAHATGLPVARIISLLQQQMPSIGDTLMDPEVAAAAKEKEKQERRERKEKRRREREARREARQRERERIALLQQQQEEEEEKQSSDTEDEVLIREAMSEVPVIGSPVPDYEVIGDDDDDDDDDENGLRKKRRSLPVPLPPADKGILMSPSYRYRDDYQPKAVKFADGILPGEGTSPSGGEEIHSPPPPALTHKEKRLRKKRKVKVKIIKLYNRDDNDDSPPPPPGSPPPLAALKLYPGYTHYSSTAPGTAVIYTQQPPQTYAYNSGQVQGAMAVPGGVVLQQGVGNQSQAPVGALGGVPSNVFSYPGYVYTTVYSPGQQLQYVLPTSLTSEAAVSAQKIGKN